MTINVLKQLRDKTGVSVMLCKKALDEAKGDFEKALKILEIKSKAAAFKKSERETKAGAIDGYIHSNRKVGVLIELRSETDFVAKNELFQKLAHDLAMHIAASNPKFVKKELIPEEIKQEARKIYEEEVSGLDKPKELREKIIEGKLNTHLNEMALYEQPFVKDQDKKVGEVIEEAILKFGENIEVARFCRFEL